MIGQSLHNEFSTLRPDYISSAPYFNQNVGQRLSLPRLMNELEFGMND